MDLLESKTPNSVEYNSILIFIDYFIKLVHYYLIYKIINTTQLAEFLFRVFTQIESLNNIISNKGSIFTSEY